MEKALVKSFFDACHYARHIIDAAHTLPQGVAPHHIFTVGALHSLSQKNGSTTIAEVAVYLGVSRKTAGYYLSDLNHKGLVQRVETSPPGTRCCSATPSTDNKFDTPSAEAARRPRHTRMALTEQGEEYHSKYVEKYYDRMMNLFKDINSNDMNITIRTIKQAYYLMAQAQNKGSVEGGKQ